MSHTPPPQHGQAWLCVIKHFDPVWVEEALAPTGSANSSCLHAGPTAAFPGPWRSR
jgi:hypothetical protein